MSSRNQKKWMVDLGSKWGSGIFDPHRLLSRKKFFDTQGFETKVKKNYPRKGLMVLYYRERK